MLTVNEQTELDILLSIEEPSELEQIRINYLQTKRDSSTEEEPENLDDEDCTCIRCKLKTFKGKITDVPNFLLKSFTEDLNLQYPLPELTQDWNSLKFFDEYIESLPEEANEGKEFEFSDLATLGEITPSIDCAFYTRMLEDTVKTDNVAVFTGLIDVNAFNTMLVTTKILSDKGFSYRSSAVFSLNYVKELIDNSLHSVKLASIRMDIDTPIEIRHLPSSEELTAESVKKALEKVLKDVI